MARGGGRVVRRQRTLVASRELGERAQEDLSEGESTEAGWDGEVTDGPKEQLMRFGMRLGFF